MQSKQAYLAQLAEKEKGLISSISFLKEIENITIESINKKKEEKVFIEKDLKDFTSHSNKEAAKIVVKNEKVKIDFDKKMKEQEESLKNRDDVCRTNELKLEKGDKKLKDDQQELCESMIALESKSEELLEFEESINERATETKKKEKEIECMHISAKSLDRASAFKFDKMNIEYKNMEEEREEFLTLIIKEESVLSIRKKDLNQKEVGLSKREKEMEDKVIWLRDRMAMLARTESIIKKKL